MAIRLKTAAEIETLREGGRRHASVLAALSRMVKPGATSQELEDAARALIAEQGAKPSFLGYRPPGARAAYPAALCVSVNDEIVHGLPNATPKVFQPGDLVKIDVGLTYNSLVTDAAVMVAVPPTRKEVLNLVAATKQALRRAIGVAKAGRRIGDISAAIAAEARKAGVSVIPELAGHGVGYALHEDPYVPNEGEAGKGPVLAPGLVIAVEPIFCTGSGRMKVAKDGFTYLTQDGSWASQEEHTIAITDGDPIVLTAR